MLPKQSTYIYTGNSLNYGTYPSLNDNLKKEFKNESINEKVLLNESLIQNMNNVSARSSIEIMPSIEKQNIPESVPADKDKSLTKSNVFLSENFEENEKEVSKSKSNQSPSKSINAEQYYEIKKRLFFVEEAIKYCEKENITHCQEKLKGDIAYFKQFLDIIMKGHSINLSKVESELKPSDIIGVSDEIRIKILTNTINEVNGCISLCEMSRNDCLDFMRINKTSTEISEDFSTISNYIEKMQKLNSILISSLNTPWQPLPKVERHAQTLRICKRNDQIDPKTMKISFNPDLSFKTSNNYLVTFFIYKNNSIVLKEPPFAPTDSKNFIYTFYNDFAKEIDQYSLEIQAYSTGFIRSQEQKINSKFLLSDLQKSNTMKIEVSSSSNKIKRLTVTLEIHKSVQPEESIISRELISSIQIFNPFPYYDVVANFEKSMLKDPFSKRKENVALTANSLTIKFSVIVYFNTPNGMIGENVYITDEDIHHPENFSNFTSIEFMKIMIPQMEDALNSKALLKENEHSRLAEGIERAKAIFASLTHNLKTGKISNFDYYKILQKQLIKDQNLLNFISINDTNAVKTVQNRIRIVSFELQKFQTFQFPR